MGGILCINLLRHSCTYICGGLILRCVSFYPRLFPFFLFLFFQRSLSKRKLSSIAISEERLYDVRWPLQHGHGHR